MTSTTIYGLADPITQKLRYVGKTSGPINVRRKQHLSEVRRGRVYIPRHKWISGLLSSGVEPEIFEIETVRDDWREAEQFWIEYFRSIGCDLLNATAGGDGLASYRHRPDTKEKMARSSVLRYADVAERKKTGEAVRLAYNDPSVRQKLIVAKSAVSSETRAKLSAIAKINCSTDHARAATSARMRGRIVSDETRKKISLSKIGRKLPQATVAKMAASRIGKKHSAETKTKMSAAAYLRYAAC